MPFNPLCPTTFFDIPTETYDPRGFYRVEADKDGGTVFIFDPEGGEAAAARRRQLSERTLEELAEGFITVLDTGRDSNDPWWKQNARLLAELLPGTGRVLSAREAYIAYQAATTAMQNGDWEQALLSGGESLFNAVGAVPVFGDLLRLGKGAVKLANLLLTLGHRLDVEPQVLAMAAAGGGGKLGKGDTPGIGHNSGGKEPNQRFVLPQNQKSVTILKSATTPIWKSFPEPGTRLYRVSGEPVADWVLERGYPLGFRSSGHYKSFIQPLQNKLRQIDTDAIIAIRGSAVTGQGFDKAKGTYTKGFFDSGAEPSDYDLSIVSSKLFRLAEEKGIKVYKEDGTSRVIRGDTLNTVKLKQEFDHMMRQAGGRQVSLVIYESLEVIKAKGTMMTLGRDLGAVQ